MPVAHPMTVRGNTGRQGEPIWCLPLTRIIDSRCLWHGVCDYLGLTLLMLDACGMHNIFLSQCTSVHNQTAPLES